MGASYKSFIIACNSTQLDDIRGTSSANLWWFKYLRVTQMSLFSQFDDLNISSKASVNSITPLTYLSIGTELVVRSLSRISVMVAFSYILRIKVLYLESILFVITSSSVQNSIKSNALS